MLKKMLLVCRSRNRMACFVFFRFVLSESEFKAELGLKWIQSVTLFYPWNTDELSDKFQMAFDSPPIFGKFYCRKTKSQIWDLVRST